MKKYFTLMIGLVIFFNGFAQEENWKTETLKDGKVTVKSKLVTQQVNNKEKNVFYYVVETIADINLKKQKHLCVIRLTTKSFWKIWAQQTR